MIRSLFEALTNTATPFLNAATGQQFEERIKVFLDNTMGYTRMRSEDVDNWNVLKESVLDKANPNAIANPTNISSAYIFQPCGSQDYPDFLVFEDNEVVSIETKYSRSSKPVWNSGLPRPNGFYIFARTPTQRQQGDITYFRGCDMVSVEEGEEMRQFFTEMSEQEKNFNDERMASQHKGFAVYVRRAFTQKRAHNSNADIRYYDSSDRARLERSVLDYFTR